MPGSPRDAVVHVHVRWRHKVLQIVGARPRHRIRRGIASVWGSRRGLGVTARAAILRQLHLALLDRIHGRHDFSLIIHRSHTQLGLWNHATVMSRHILRRFSLALPIHELWLRPSDTTVCSESTKTDFHF